MFQNRMLNRITHPMAPHKSPVPYEIEAVPPVVLQYLRDGGPPSMCIVLKDAIFERFRKIKIFSFFKYILYLFDLS